MVLIPGFIISILTFPGVILHEWSHKFSCNLAGVEVFEVKYFRLGNPAGYVRHGKITRYRDAFLITIAPFFVNSIFAMLMFILPALNLNGVVNLFFLWLGVSFALHSFPSDGDARNLWDLSKNTWRISPVALIGFPLVAAIVIANLLRIFWFDLIYAGILFGITFGVVGAVIFAGSTIAGLPVPSAHPVPPASPAYKATGNAMPIYSPAQSVAGKEAPAKDWLSIAQNAITKKNSNAVLISVDGHSNDGGIALPINGKSHLWKYTYASKPEDLAYDVTVHDGVLEGIGQRSLSNSPGAENILYKYGDPTIGSWNLDSTDAANISCGKFKELTGTDAPASAAYALELSCWGRLTWTVYNYDSTTRVIEDISVDEETGAISHTWPDTG